MVVTGHAMPLRCYADDYACRFLCLPRDDCLRRHILIICAGYVADTPIQRYYYCLFHAHAMSASRCAGFRRAFVTPLSIRRFRQMPCYACRHFDDAAISICRAARRKQQAAASAARYAAARKMSER